MAESNHSRLLLELKPHTPHIPFKKKVNPSLQTNFNECRLHEPKSQKDQTTFWPPPYGGTSRFKNSSFITLHGVLTQNKSSSLLPNCAVLTFNGLVWFILNTVENLSDPQTWWHHSYLDIKNTSCHVFFEIVYADKCLLRWLRMTFVIINWANMFFSVLFINPLQSNLTSI